MGVAGVPGWDLEIGRFRFLSEDFLRRAEKRIANLQQEIQEYYWDFIVTGDLLELRNIATVAGLIVTSALQRPEIRGLNYNLDYPNPHPEWAQQDTVLRRTS